MNHSVTPHRSDAAIDGLVACATGPAFVVAMRTGRLERTNPAGRDWLGEPPRAGLADPETAQRETVLLDPAMPAVKRLRELAESLGPGTRCSVTLTFWTALGVQTRVCDVAFAGAGDDTLALVEVGSDKTAAEAQTCSQSPSRTPAQPVASFGSGPTPGDAAILKEIARRIREGQSMRAQKPDDPAVTPADLPPAELSTSGATPEPQSVRIAKLAHELKTPLSAIAAAAEIMRDERLGPIENARYRSYASDIFDSARHALMVIGNMLGDAAAGIEFDQGSSLPAMVFTEVNLNAVAESCVSSMRPLADAAGLTLSASLGDGLPHVVADATAIRQIALNLLNNAVKFSGPGGEIRLMTRYDSDGRVELVVRDTGRGMTADEIAKAGVPHERVALSRREGGGLGIGLPLVGALARANGAGIAIASEPLRGTTVTLSFAKDRVVPV